jgi:hypothetical protein
VDILINALTSPVFSFSIAYNFNKIKWYLLPYNKVNPIQAVEAVRVARG